ncbi:hypothetical protein DL240_08890 [Lujinxingia litoralis]|uniref:Amine oxidase domain-containing protein n=1 Tax=Lujinxingia litoralis TaxID=2211119 RepID=A0A328C6V8_9DELT|nr:FAD-dependent oxidoreductase [Lujinxingia litoralis]RAL22996.1 hypothetical protein DL240_08890 [Lujinxingia litoralis]
MSERVVIVGAGMGGLSAALRLSAHPDLDILVVDALEGPGGKVGTAHHQGLAFDTGPSVLTMPGVLTELFEAADLRLEEHLKLIHPEHLFRYHFGSGTALDVHFDPADTARAIAQTLDRKAAGEFENFLNYCRRIWEAAAPNFVMGPAPSFGGVFKLGLSALAKMRAIDPMRTMKAAIDAQIRSPELRDLFYRYATYNGSDPRQAPATLNCIAWVELGLGCYGIEGGMRRLATALFEAAQHQGVRFSFQSPVERIARHNDGFELRIHGDRLRADRLIINADVAHLVHDLLSEDTAHGIAPDPTPSMSGYTALFQARRRSPAQRPAHQVLFPDGDYLEEFVDIFDRQRAPQAPTIYLCAQEKAHAAPGWQEHEPLFAMTNAPATAPDGSTATDWHAHTRHITERLVRTGLLAPDDAPVWVRTPDALATRFPGSRGSIYGAASNSRFAAFKRPANRAAGLPGLYLASGSAHPGGGVPLCLQSGRQAAESLLLDRV